VNKIKVIIADDHILFRKGTRHLLEQEQDIEVIGEASAGDVAVELVTKLHPQVALMDIAIPKGNGVEATRQTKTRYPATAVLILTAYDNNSMLWPYWRGELLVTC
jgi:NarL family two-component system response regulator LiaR